MGDTLEIREKTTATIQMTLLNDGEAIDLSSVDHVELRMVDSLGNTYRYSSADITPAVEVVTATSGIVSFTPPAETVFMYLRQPYNIFWWVFADATTKYSVPSMGYNMIKVFKEY